MLIQGILAPLQGFWNFLTYIRPRYNMVAERNRDKSVIHRLYLTIFQRSEIARNRLVRQSKPSWGCKMCSKKKSKTNLSSQRTPSSSRNYLIPILRRNKNPDNFEDNEQSSDDVSSGAFQEKIEVLIEDDEEEGVHNKGEEINEDNYRQAVTLSLLIAEDILPPSSYSEGRRASMVERFPLSLSITEPNTSQINISDREDPNQFDSESFVFPPPTIRRERRNSCPGFLELDKS